ncbi:Vacuolar protein sorting-associated protein 26A [Camellia lanceoleosa]|uniref:Vacuolar protein sorting-associated protein 26A n=1 Tax=Camellia lanceoleosa TaxID=1840588 RepID=A0ACC0GHB5_9ERIC|nr:Vacuolar protein sorting-associated protein 26A [Camellia lanceoleosa]
MLGCWSPSAAVLFWCKASVQLPDASELSLWDDVPMFCCWTAVGLMFYCFDMLRYVLKVTISRGYSGSIVEYQDFDVISL